MRILICDDDKKFGSLLKDHINNTLLNSHYYDDSFRVELFDSSNEALSFIKKYDVDIIFLDISMPGIDGFGIAEYIAENKKSSYIIFVSNFEDRVFSSLKYRPFRFIRKSNYKEESVEALNAAVQDMSIKNRCIMINNHNNVTPVRLSNIIYIEKEKRTNYIQIFCAGDKLRYRGTLTYLESELSEHNFAKASPNAFINLEHVVRISEQTVFLDAGYKYIITSSKYLADFTKRFLEYMRNN